MPSDYWTKVNDRWQQLATTKRYWIDVGINYQDKDHVDYGRWTESPLPSPAGVAPSPHTKAPAEPGLGYETETRSIKRMVLEMDGHGKLVRHLEEIPIGQTNSRESVDLIPL